MQFEKHFTLDEANRLIPELTQLLNEMLIQRDDIQEKGTELQGLQSGNGSLHKEQQFIALSQELARTVEEMEANLKRVNELGCQVKDLEMGLVDFPALRGDDEVLLCWRLGEEQIRFWHDLTSGFAGRQPLSYL